MKLGIGEYYIRRYGLEDGARKMASHGYEYIDYNLMDIESDLYVLRDEDFVRMLYDIKKKLNAQGISVMQIHGPWRLPDNRTDEERAEHFEKATKALVMAKYLGAKYMAIHPLLPFGISPEGSLEVYAINKQFFSALANVAGNLGVTVCLENLPFTECQISRVESVVALIKDVDHPNLKMCFDVGHANVFEGRIGEKIRLAGDLIKIIHVHDNMGDADSHLLPYEGCVDWADLAEGLFDVGFDGVFNLECAPVSKKRQNEDVSDTEASALEENLARTARLIAG